MEEDRNFYIIIVIRVFALLGLLFIACGEVGTDPIGERSSGSHGSQPSSSSAGFSGSSSSNVLGLDFLNWRAAPTRSYLHDGGMEVHVDPYLISANLITQQQYQTVMGENPSGVKGGSLPVESVTWFNAEEFCKKLSVLMGKNENAIRMPTEAEWEIVTYPLGSVIQRNYDYWEWTNDCFDSVFPFSNDNPSGPPNCLISDPKVRKGFNLDWGDRKATDPYFSDVNIGFRVVIRAEDYQ